MASINYRKDYYSTLGLASTVSTADIKSAYRKLALALHPDKNNGCKVREAHFILVKEAYEVLSSELRPQYDLRRQARNAMKNYATSSMRSQDQASTTKVPNPGMPSEVFTSAQDARRKCQTSPPFKFNKKRKADNSSDEPDAKKTCNESKVKAQTAKKSPEANKNKTKSKKPFEYKPPHRTSPPPQARKPTVPPIKLVPKPVGRRMSGEEAKSMSPGLPFPDFSKQKTWKQASKEPKMQNLKTQQPESDKLLRDLLGIPRGANICESAMESKATASPYMSNLCTGLRV